MENNHMGIDQYGNTYHNLGKHPRKELLKRCGGTRAVKIYRGEGTHTGYAMTGNLWIDLYKVTPINA